MQESKKYARLFNNQKMCLKYILRRGCVCVLFRAVKRSNCFHQHGHTAKCSMSPYPYVMIFGAIQIVLSQIPNFHKLSWLSILAALMSFAYSSIGLALSIAKLAGALHQILIFIWYFFY